MIYQNLNSNTSTYSFKKNEIVNYLKEIQSTTRVFSTQIISSLSLSLHNTLSETELER
jgi:hypothetical protein